MEDYKLKAYQVLSYNLDVPSNGVFNQGIFAEIDDAIKLMKAYPASVDGFNITEDLEGKKEHFQGKSLQYDRPHHKPAVYYNSYWGNYKCVVFIKEIFIQ